MTKDAIKTPHPFTLENLGQFNPLPHGKPSAESPGLINFTKHLQVHGLNCQLNQSSDILQQSQNIQTGSR